MAHSDVDISACQRGCVVAPAGYGKTHLIATALKDHKDPKPALVLTHTNAGVSALRLRLAGAKVPQQFYRLHTIDGWALTLASMFPIRSAVRSEALELSNPKTDYPVIRQAAAHLLQGGHIDDCLAATYSRVIVDEYQDCSIRQHLMLVAASQLLPTVVLGDPMQAIFGFGKGDSLIDWNNDACQSFPVIGELSRPWRWVNSNAEDLGEWLKTVAIMLGKGEAVSLADATTTKVKVVTLTGEPSDYIKLTNAARYAGKGSQDRVLIVGDSTNAASRHKLARSIDGATVVEPVELSDVLKFLRKVDLGASDVLSTIVSYAKSLMTGVDQSKLLARTTSIQRGKAKKLPSAVEASCCHLLQERSMRSAANVFSTLANSGQTRVYRPGALHACIRSLELAAAEVIPPYDAGIQVREQLRAFGRPLPRRAVGSTLLLKGLEADISVLLNAHKLDAKNLYVALTRGSKEVIICSQSVQLPAPETKPKKKEA